MDLGRDQAPDKVVRQQLNLLDQVYCQHEDHPMRLLSQEQLPEVALFRI
jgi:hypothetical protein